MNEFLARDIAVNKSKVSALMAYIRGGGVCGFDNEQKTNNISGTEM